MTPLLSSNPSSSFSYLHRLKLYRFAHSLFTIFIFRKMIDWSNRESQSIHIFTTTDLGQKLYRVRKWSGGGTVFQSQAQGQGRTSEIGCREHSVKRAAPLLALGERVKGSIRYGRNSGHRIFIGLPLYLSRVGPSVELHYLDQSHPSGDTITWWLR